jgi:hypothetical protein
MIAFNKGWSPSSFTSEDLKEILTDILSNKHKLHGSGVKCGGLSPAQIQDIIAYLIYQEENSSIQFTVSVEEDNYHLSLSIDKKEKKP